MKKSQKHNEKDEGKKIIEQAATYVTSSFYRPEEKEKEKEKKERNRKKHDFIFIFLSKNRLSTLFYSFISF